MEKLGALPKAGQAPAVPPRLDNTTPDPRGLVRRTLDRDIDAAAAIAAGGSRAINAKTRDEAAGGVHDAIGGGMVLAEPALGAALAANPVTTLAALGVGTGGGQLAQAGASGLGATENEAALAGDVGGLLAGGLTAKAATPVNVATARGAISGAAKATPRAVADAVADIPALRSLVPVAKEAKLAALAARAKANGGVTPGQQAALDRYLAAHPEVSLADAANISPEDLAPSRPPAPRPPVELKPDIQELLDAAQNPAPPKDRVPVWQNPTLTEPIREKITMADLARTAAAEPAPAPAPAKSAPAPTVKESLSVQPPAKVTLADVARDPVKAMRDGQRAVKVSKVAEHLAKNGLEPSDLDLISPRQWTAVAQSAGVNDLTPAQIELVKQQFGGTAPKRALQPGPNAFNPGERGSIRFSDLMKPSGSADTMGSMNKAPQDQPQKPAGQQPSDFIENPSPLWPESRKKLHDTDAWFSNRGTTKRQFVDALFSGIKDALIEPNVFDGETGTSIRVTHPPNSADHVWIDVDGNIKVNGNQSHVELKRMFSDEGTVNHHLFELKGASGASDQSVRGTGIARKVLSGALDAYKQLNLKRVNIHAGLDSGAYVWAKYGFEPSQESWNVLRGELLNEIDSVPEHSRGAVRSILEDSNPSAITRLADVKTYGKKLLLGKEWEGGLDLNDENINKVKSRLNTKTE
jgi:hypothetical protein